MAATPYPLPRELRETGVLVGNGTVGPYGPTSFKVFDTVDVEVWVKAEDDEDFARTFAVSVAKTSAAELATVTATFSSTVPATEGQGRDEFPGQGAVDHGDGLRNEFPTRSGRRGVDPWQSRP
jgi:hypothetical protein